MNTLHSIINDYLSIRRALGYKLELAGPLLHDFADFLQQHGQAHITTQRALQWAMTPADSSQTRCAKRLAIIRGLAKYAHALDPRTEIPPQELLPMPVPRSRSVYLYSPEDVQALMDATRIFRGLRRATYRTLIGLLAVTGMRVGEAIDLDRADVDWKDAMLLVRHAKFGKVRQLPLHPSTVAALRVYARERDQAVPHPQSPSFLLSLQGTRLFYKNVHHGFLRMVRQAGIENRLPHRPRIHDLRHSFATHTLLDWLHDGRDIDPRMFSLSTYMGHVCPSHTYWYLTATPQLLQHAAQRFHAWIGGLP